jgi:hypothetical protein
VVAGTTPILVHNCGPNGKLYFAGSAKSRGNDFEENVDANGIVHPPTSEQIANLSPEGKSTYDTVENLRDAPISAGQQIRSFSNLPDGVGAIEDGIGVGGTRPMGHVTVHPTRPMPKEEFDDLLNGSGWANFGEKTR